MAAPPFVDQATSEGTSNSASCSKPSGTLEGHLLVAQVSVESGTTTIITPPAGWRLAQRADQSTNVAVAVYVKVAGDSEGSSYAFGLSAAVKWAVGISAWADVDTTLIPVQRVGLASAAANSVTLPAHVAGDVILIFAYRDGNATAPALGSGYTNLASGGANSNGARVGYKVAAGSSEVSGTWTNATEIIAIVLRNAGVPRISAAGGSASTVIAYPALTGIATDGTSIVYGFAGHRTATNVEQAPTDMTNIATAGTEAAAHEHAGRATDWPATNVTVDANSGWRAYTVEVPASSPSGVDVGAVGSGASGNGVAPAVTTTGADRTVLVLYGSKANTAWAPDGSTTERYDDPNQAAGLPSLMMASFEQASAGSTGTKTATPTTSAEWAAVTIALIPGASGPQELERTASDTTAVSDTAGRAVVALRSSSDTPAVLAESVERVIGFPRTATDTLADVAESVDRAALDLSRTATDAPVTTESVGRLTIAARTVSDAPTAPGESVARIVGFPRTAADTLATPGDLVARLLVASRSSSDTAPATATIGRQVVGGRSATDTLASSDAVGRQVAASRAASDVAPATATVGRALTMARAIADALGSIVDTVAGVIGPTGEQVFRTAADAITTSETVSRLLTYGRSAADAVPLSESVTRSAAAARSVADALGISDAVARSIGAARSAADTLGIADLLERLAHLRRSSADTLESSDTVTASMGVPIIQGTIATVSVAPTLAAAVPADGGRAPTVTIAPTPISAPDVEP